MPSPFDTTPHVETLAPQNRGHARAAIALWVLGIACFALWIGWWARSMKIDRLAYGQATWVHPLPFLGGDFRVHIDHVSRLWAAGRDFYLDPCCPRACREQPFAPTVPRLFTWVRFFDTKTATRVWIGSLAAIVVLASAVVACKRLSLGLKTPPWPVLAALLGFCTPFVTAMERAQIDPIVIPALFLAGWLLTRNGPHRATCELFAGALLGVFAWVKYYPALAFVGLLALKRGRAAAAFCVVFVGIGVIDLPRVREAIAMGTANANDHDNLRAHTNVVQHSIAKFWPRIWHESPFPAIAKIPGSAVAACSLGMPMLLLAARVARSPARDRLATPLLLWLTAAGTFALPYSNDYNLTALPIALLSVWSLRDHPAIHVAAMLMLPWWQPFIVPIEGPPLFVAKIAGLYAIAACIESRLTALESRMETRPSAIHAPWFKRRALHASLARKAIS